MDNATVDAKANRVAGPKREGTPMVAGTRSMPSDRERAVTERVDYLEQLYGLLLPHLAKSVMPTSTVEGAVVRTYSCCSV